MLANRYSCHPLVSNAGAAAACAASVSFLRHSRAILGATSLVNPSVTAASISPPAVPCTRPRHSRTSSPSNLLCSPSGSATDKESSFAASPRSNARVWCGLSRSTRADQSMYSAYVDDCEDDACCDAGFLLLLLLLLPTLPSCGRFLDLLEPSALLELALAARDVSTAARAYAVRATRRVSGSRAMASAQIWRTPSSTCVTV